MIRNFSRISRCRVTLVPILFASVSLVLNLLVGQSPIFLCKMVGAQERPSRGASSKPSSSAQEVAPSEQEQLASQQRLLAERFGKLEELFLRMSEFESSTNPTRASLLQQAAKLSKEMAMAQRMSLASELITKRQFSRAIEEQQASTENLRKLLELLQSENRQDRLRDERKKYEEWIKDIEKLGRLERSLRGRTENGQDSKQSSKDQADIAAQAKKIADQISDLMREKGESVDDSESAEASKESEGNSSKKPAEKENPSDPAKPVEKPSKAESEDPSNQGDPSEGQASDSKPSDSKPAESKPSDSKPSDSKPSDGESSDSSSDSKGGKSESGEPSKKDSKPPSPESKARQKVEQARKKMQEAIEKLDKDNRKGAVKDESAAEKELKDAVAELEKILQQLREEEVERSLASLEARFRKMLDLQNSVNEETNRIHSLTGDARDRQVEIQSSKLALEERKILVEGERALLLLSEEGSSTAFPEAVQQMVADIRSVVERLQRADVGELTIGIEKEIVAALEEMVQALTQVQKQNSEKKKQAPEGQPPSGGGDQEQPLVDKLAELRLIRTLQLRVNNRTERLSKTLRDPADPIGKAQDKDLQNQLLELAGRQEKIQEVTRDLVIKSGKRE